MSMPLIALFGILVVIVVIAFSYPSFEERTRTDEDDKKTPSGKRKFGFGWLVIFLAVLAGIWAWKAKIHFPVVSAIIYPIAADAQDVWPRVGETVKIKIYPDCLSGWINLPKGANFMIDAPGEIEYFFWTGERIFVKDKNTKWLGEIPRCSFQLRGTAGEATITVQ